MMHVRAARPDDETFVAALVPRFVEHGAADGHSPETVIEGTTRVLREALRDASADDVLLIAEDEHGERLGFVYAVTQRDFFTRERYAHVSEIAVARSGEGVGGALMDAVERWSRKRGYRTVSLNVVDANRAAQRFYERRGYGIGHRHYVKRVEPGER